MKTINKYLIERLHITKNSTAQSVSGYEEIEIPKFDTDGWSLVPNESWRKIKIPDALYVVYKDMYRNSLVHFADMQDFIASVIMFQDDYENYDFNKDILFASNDLKEILDWYFNYLGISDRPVKGDEYDWASENDKPFNDKTCDDPEVIARAYIGTDKYYPRFDKPKPYWKDTIDSIIDTWGLDNN